MTVYAIDAMIPAKVLVGDRGGWKRVEIDGDFLDLTADEAKAVAKALSVGLGGHDFVPASSGGYVTIHRTLGGAWVGVDLRDGSSSVLVPDAMLERLAVALTAEAGPDPPKLVHAEIKEARGRDRGRGRNAETPPAVP